VNNALRMAIDTRVAEDDRIDEWAVGTSMRQMVEHCGCALITKAPSGWETVKVKVGGLRNQERHQ
jgi:hypothetical protein